MNHYELTLILNPDLGSKFDPYKEHFESVLSQLGFNIQYYENVGIRELAYIIGINKKGHYLIYQLDGDPEYINELETKIKYDNSVIRHLVLKIDKVTESDSFLTQDTKDAKKRAEERAHEAKLKSQVQQQLKPAPSETKEDESSSEEKKDESHSGEKESPSKKETTSKKTESENEEEA
tara:strand:+ start:68 stop:601 length:534 start_codon:yes stop_codon:yes gene_type:complete